MDRDGNFTIGESQYRLVNGTAIGSVLYSGQWFVEDVANPDPHAVLWCENTYRQARDRVDRMAERSTQAHRAPTDAHPGGH